MKLLDAMPDTFFYQGPSFNNDRIHFWSLSGSTFSKSRQNILPWKSYKIGRIKEANELEKLSIFPGLKTKIVWPRGWLRIIPTLQFYASRDSQQMFFIQILKWQWVYGNPEMGASNYRRGGIQCGQANTASLLRYKWAIEIVPTKKLYD